MEEFVIVIYSFFHDWFFVGFLGVATFTSIFNFYEYLGARSEKDPEKMEKKGVSLWLCAGIVLISWAFYSMSFLEIGFEKLNIALVVTFSLLAIAGMIAFYDKNNRPQKNIDHFI